MMINKENEFQCFVDDDRRDDLLTDVERRFMERELRPDGRFDEGEIEDWMLPIIEGLLKKKGFVSLETDEYGTIHLFSIVCPKDIDNHDYRDSLFSELKSRVESGNTF